MTETLNVEKIRADFPIFTRAEKQPLVYLDSASSSQKPSAVIDAMSNYYETTHANVHRGVYSISETASAMYEGVRTKIANFIGASSEREITFSKNVTESLNLVIQSYSRSKLKRGDVVVLTEMEHHANLVPWHMMVSEIGIELRFIPISSDYTLDLTNLDALLDGAKVVSITAMSNVLGSVTDLAAIIPKAHAAGAVVFVDAAQLVPHRRVNVVEMGADAVGFTSHKMLGPTGAGVLWGTTELLNSIPPFLGGGDMILDVRLDGYTPNEIPWKFEAGTPPIAEVIGLGTAVDYLSDIDFDALHNHEAALTNYAIESIKSEFGNKATVYASSDEALRGGVVSFALENVHPHDVSQILDEQGVCVRAGHHCAKPLMKCLGVNATARASFYLYNDTNDVDALIAGLKRAYEVFG